MESKINIWGKPGYLLPDGEMCQACCVGGWVPELDKLPNNPCRFQCKNGCSLHNQGGQPNRCQSYHCSTDTNPNRLAHFIHIALVLSLVTQTEASSAFGTLPPPQIVEDIPEAYRSEADIVNYLLKQKQPR